MKRVAILLAAVSVLVAVTRVQASMYAASMYVEEHLNEDDNEISDEDDDDSADFNNKGEDDLKNDPTRRRLLRTNTLPKNKVLPVQCSIRLVLESIKSIGSDATMDFYMEYIWKDDREQHKEVFLSGRKTDTFAWIPDIYFLLAKQVTYMDNTQYLYIKKGFMLYDQKISVTVPCIPHPFNYPFDQVTCKVIMSSYGYDETQLNVSWRGQGVAFPESYDELEYIGFRWATEDPMQVSSSSVQYGNLNYTVLYSCFKFNRLYSVYVLQLFLPAALLVIISWSSFWVNMGATPGRAGIGVTTILTLLTLTTNRKLDMDSKYLSLHTNLLDIYLWTCFLYVIMAFLEFSVSDHLKASDKKLKMCGCIINGKRMNVISRYLFPVTFLLFNLIFWVYVAVFLKT